MADLAVTTYSNLTSTPNGAVAVLLGKGNGTFQTPVNYPVTGDPVSVVAIDFNGDGKLDLAVGCQVLTQKEGTIAIFTGNGDGTFQTPVTYGTGGNPVSIAAGDFDGDGRVDMAVASSYDGTVSVFLGIVQLIPTATTLASSLNPSSYGQAVTLTAAVLPSGATGFVTFYGGTTLLGTSPLVSGQAVLTTTVLPSGTDALTAIYGGAAAYGVSTSASLAQSVTAAAGNGPAEARTFAVGPGPQSVVAGDLNGDGIVDLAVANYIGNSVSVLLGNGNGTFQQAVTYATGVNPYSVALGDFKGDGNTDIVVANSGGSISLLLKNGDGTFQTAVTLISESPFEPVSVAVGDFNGDGKANIVFANALNSGVGVMLGNGDGTFQATQYYGAGVFTRSVAVGDFNGDGKADLVAGNEGSNNVSVLLGNGDGTFQAAVTYAAGTQPEAVAVGDFNGNGKPDFVVANELGNNLSVLLNRGNGTFASAVNYATGQHPVSVVVGDFNGDGKPDLAAANNLDGTVSILTGNGDGTFQPAVNYATGNGPTSVATADFNADGLADLAVANSSDNTVGILLGTPVSASTTTFVELRASPQNTYGNQETLTALVSPSNATGTVAFLDGTVSLGTVSLNNGVATLMLTTLAAGVHSLTASYGGDAKDSSSVSAAVTLTVSQSTTATRLTSSANPSTPGQSITLTATVSSPLTATGSVTFSDGLTALGTVALSGGTATLTLATLPSGTNTLFAAYSGDVNNISSTGKLVQTVGQPTTTTTSLSSSSNPSIYGQSLTLTATVASQASTGMVTFYDGTTVLGVGTLANGSTSLTTRLPASGARSLTAYYGGDFTHLASLSPKLPHTVNTLPSSGFQDAVDYGTGVGSWSVVAADFNGDGNIDLAVTDSGGVNVLLGKGDGTFQSALNVSTGSAIGLMTGDFNGDGKADLAYGLNSGPPANYTQVLLGNGDGTFRAGASYPVSGLSNPSFAPGSDFNEDGYTDFAVFSGEINQFLGNGDGTFHPGTSYGAGAFGSNTSGAVGDFNGDGHADLAVTTASANEAGVAILLGNGDGTFQVPTGNYSVGSTPIYLNSVAVGDFNGDGFADLAVASYVNGTTPGKLSILLGKGDGTFQAAVNYAVDAVPESLAVGDFNGDGNIDIATASSTGGDVSVLLGNGDGTFRTAVDYAVGSAPQSIATADFNGDGRIDFAVANSGSNNVSVLLGTALTVQSISFGPLTNVTLGTAPFTIGPTASSGLTVSLASITPATCSVSEATVTLIFLDANGILTGTDHPHSSH